MNPAPSPLSDLALLDNSVTVLTTRDEAFEQLSVPADNMMYHHLMQAAKDVITVALRNGVSGYKRTMMTFNALRSGANDSVLPCSIRPPVLKTQIKRGRSSETELVNRYKTVRTSKPTAGSSCRKQCSACAAKGVVATDHRKGSKCPFVGSKE